MCHLCVSPVCLCVCVCVCVRVCVCVHMHGIYVGVAFLCVHKHKHLSDCMVYSGVHKVKYSKSASSSDKWLGS